MRVLYGYNRAEAYAVGEFQTDTLGSPKLILLPSPMGLNARAWADIEARFAGEPFYSSPVPSMGTNTSIPPAEQRRSACLTTLRCSRDAMRFSACPRRCRARIRGPGTRMAMARSFSAMPSVINLKPPHTSVRERTLKRKAQLKKDESIIYLASSKDCGGCSLKQRCTASTARRVSRHIFERLLRE